MCLEKLCNEIDERKQLLQNTNLKDINSYNKLGNNIPDIILILDELNSFDKSQAQDDLINYITPNGCRYNIYVIITVNYPSSEVISPISKFNLPARICFKVTSSKVSKSVLDDVGVEKLNRLGDALYNSRLNDTTIKVKVPCMKDDEIKRLTDFWKKQGTTKYDEEFSNIDGSADTPNRSIFGDGFNGDSDDGMYDEVVKFAVETGKISTSLIQRRFRFGYNRAARMMDILESRSVVGPQNGSKPREVLIKLDKHEEVK